MKRASTFEMAKTFEGTRVQAILDGCKKEEAMRKLATLFLAVVVYALMGVGVAAADGDDSRKRQQTPESIVICGDQGIVWQPARLLPGLEQEVPVPIPRATLGVETITTPESIALERCNRGASCAPCIRSLENQGCTVLDLIVNAGGSGSGAGIPGFGIIGSNAVFVLSCEKP